MMLLLDGGASVDNLVPCNLSPGEKNRKEIICGMEESDGRNNKKKVF